MRLMNNLKGWMCASKLPQEYIYTNGTSIFSLSQLVTTQPPRFPNFYFHSSPSIPPMHSSTSANSIYRCILNPTITQEMNFNINTLKADPMLKQLLQMSEEEKQLAANSSQMILIEGQISREWGKQPKDKDGQDSDEIKSVLKNMVQLQKLFHDGLSLPVSYVISNKNTYTYTTPYLTLLKRKSKAIHSNIAQLGLNFPQMAHDQGYQLHHIFLLPVMKDGAMGDKLSNCTAYNVKQVLDVMSSISFAGKVILEADENWEENVEYLQKIAKEAGYQRKQKGQLDDNTWYTML